MPNQAEFEAWLDFLRGEVVDSPTLLCCVCGDDSDAWAEFVDDDGKGIGEYICKKCTDQDSGG